MPVVLDHNVNAVPIRDRIRRGQFDHFLIVVPTRRRLRYLTREIIALVPGSTVPALPLHTLESLATALVEAIFDTRRIVDGPVQMLLYDRAVGASASKLMYFTGRNRDGKLSRGTFEKVVDVINHLKESGVYPDMLEGELDLAELDEKSKLQDIISIYKSYEDVLAAMGAMDSGDIFKLLRQHCTQQQFERGFRKLFPQADTVSLAGFDEFTEPELDFVRKLCAVSGLSGSLVFDFLPGNSGLFGHLEDNYRYFRGIGFADAGERSSSAARMPMLTDNLRMPAIQDGVSGLARGLFNRSWTGQKIDLSQHVVVAQLRNRVQEVELICKIVKQLVLERPERDLSRICVASIQPQLYTDLMRVTFPKYGIPVNITDRYALNRSPLLVAILALLQVPMRGFRREDVIKALRMPYFMFGSGRTSVDYGNLLDVSSQLKIVSGYDAWLSRIDNRLKMFDREAALTSDDHDRSSLARQRAHFEKARIDIEWLRQLLAGVAAPATPREFQRQVIHLLEELQIRRRLAELSPGLDTTHAEKDARAFAKFLEVLEETVGLMEWQGEGGTTHPLKYYVEHLNVAILKQRYNIREQVGSGVLVTAIEETRGLPLDVMILAGLVDGEFPSVYQPEVFFSAQRQREREERHTWQNRYLFYQAVTNWSERLYLTVPEKDGDLELVRSTFVDTFQNVAEVTEWQGGAAAPFAVNLYSEEEVLQFAARHGGNHRFLTELPSDMQSKLDDVQRSIAVDRSRTETHDLPQFEGVIGGHLSPDARRELDQLKTRVYSTSQLESYGKCPYQFFAQRLLRLRMLEDLDERLTPLEKGSVLHEALFEFYSSRREKDLPLITQCSEKEFEEAVSELTRITTDKLDEVDIPDAFWDIDKEAILGRQGLRKGLLRDFLEYEHHRTTALEPRYFEVAFGPHVGQRRGRDKILSTEETIAVGTVNLRGKIDRVEVGSDAFAIIDYKTGKEVAGIEEIRQGISLQLPLYLYAMEQLLRRVSGPPQQPAAGLYYMLREPVKVQPGLASVAYGIVTSESGIKPKQLVSVEELRRMIDEAVAVVNRHVEGMTQGKFPLTTLEKVDKVCSFCDYKTICRIQTVRRVPSGKTEDL